MKTIIESKNAPKPIGPYSQAVKAGGFLFCSGLIAIDPKTGETKLGPAADQTKQVMENIRAVLQEAGLGFQNIVKTTIFLTDMNDFTAVGEIYGKYMPAPPPARTTIEVARLPKGVSVEIEVIASYE